MSYKEFGEESVFVYDVKNGISAVDSVETVGLEIVLSDIAHLKSNLNIIYIFGITREYFLIRPEANNV
jgi:hypothetical protein